MGLDMYLFRAKKVIGLTQEDYGNIEMVVQDVDTREIQSSNIDLEILSGVHGSNQLDVLTIGTKETFQYYSVLEEIGYWRKANQIHAWFVKNVQNDIDNCQYTQVRLGDLRALLILVDRVLYDHSKAKELFPVQEGFFFGSFEYDKWYFEDFENTKKILEKALDTTDWDSQIVFYHSSW